MVTTKQTRIPKVMEQFLALKRAFPGSKGGVRKNRLRWTVTLKPSSLSDEYKVRLLYSLERSPKVFVGNPELLKRNDERIPHRYADGSLCLYLPAAREWDSSMYLADTIVPWTAEWLIHYELWHATGEWHGGGFHLEDGGKWKPREVFQGSR